MSQALQLPSPVVVAGNLCQALPQSQKEKEAIPHLMVCHLWAEDAPLPIQEQVRRNPPYLHPSLFQIPMQLACLHGNHQSICLRAMLQRDLCCSHPLTRYHPHQHMAPEQGVGVWLFLLHAWVPLCVLDCRFPMVDPSPRSRMMSSLLELIFIHDHRSQRQCCS